MKACLLCETDVTAISKKCWVFEIYSNGSSAGIKKSAHIVLWARDVDALIQTFSLNIHSFVPVQQFMSDNQKLDYQCDMSGICQRQISGMYLVYNI